MLKQFLLPSLIIFLFSAVQTLAQNVARPNVIVPNGFEVNSYTGNLYHARTDLKIPGQGLSIDVTFSYNVSRRNKDWGLGKGWTFTYNMAYKVDTAGIWLERADGKRELYRKTGSTYVAPRGVFDALVEYQAGKFYVQTKDNARYYFDSPTHKRLTKLQDARGNQINLVYTDTLLNALTDGIGHTLTFSWAYGRLSSMTDNSCQPYRKINYEYDDKGNPIKITNQLGDFVRYYYDSTARIIGFTDEGGNNMSMQYKPSSAVIKVNSCASSHLFTYIPAQRKTYVTEKVNGQSVITTYIYDIQGRIASKKGNCCGFNVDYTYDSQDNVISKRDGNNKETKYEYDSRGNIIKEIDPNGNFNTYISEPTFNKVTRFQDKNGNVTTYQYDANGNLIQINKPLSIIEKYTFDNKGNKITEIDPNDNITAYEYNEIGYLIKIKNPEGGITKYTYDCRGNRLATIDPRGNTTTYEYNAKDQLVKLTNALNQSISYFYDKVGNLIEITNALNKTTGFAYDGLKRRISTILPLTNTTTTDYDEQGNIIKQVDENGNNITYTYNNYRKPLTVKDALGNIISYEYDEAGNKIIEVDKKGNVTRFQYDDQNRLVKFIDALNGERTYNYDAGGKQIQQLNSRGYLTSYTYDASGRIVKITDALGKYIEYTYNGIGLRVTEKDKNGNLTSFTYDRLNRLKTITNPAGAIFFYEYDPNGNIISEKNSLDQSAIYTYDVLNRKSSVTNGVNEVTKYVYDEVGNLKQIINSDGNIITHEYNDNNQLVVSRDNIGIISSFTYDKKGNIISETDGNNHVKKTIYDALNRQKQVVDALNHTTSFTFDSNNNLISQTDRNGNSKFYTYDALNRKISETDANGYITRFSYDATGNRLSLIDAKGNTTSYSYDSVNQLVDETYADGSKRVFTYDSNGNRKTRKDNNGNVTTYFYNSLNRLIKRSYSNINEATFTYDLIGRRLSANNNNSTIVFTYDKINRVLSESLNGNITSYTYNSISKINSIKYPGGRAILEEVNERGHIINKKEGLITIANFKYDLGDRIVKKTFSNGFTSNYVYNANNWLLSFSCQPNNALSYNYSYDNEGNRTMVIKNDRPMYSEKYIYSNTYQLNGFYTGNFTGETLSDTTSKYSYNYDALNNRVSSRENSLFKNYTSNNLNAYTSIVSNGSLLNYSYDRNGNTTSDGIKSYEYNNENKLVKVNNGAIATHLYDALGRRIKTTLNNKAITYLYDGNRVIEERDESNKLLKTYVYGTWIDDIISYSKADKTYYLLNDQQGSVLAVTDDLDIVERYDYTAFGEIKYYDKSYISISESKIDNDITFTGRVIQPYQELYDFRSRVYDSKNGRFRQRDLLGYVDGASLYNPYFIPNKIDPYGSCAVVLVAGDFVLIAAIYLGIIKINGDLFQKYQNIYQKDDITINYEETCKGCLESSRATTQQRKVLEEYKRIEDAGRKNPDDPDSECNDCPVKAGQRFNFQTEFADDDAGSHGCKESTGSSLHWHYSQYNQNRKTCECFLAQRLFGGCGMAPSN